MPEPIFAGKWSRREQVEIAESALDMDWLEAEQLKKLWGTSRFPEYYKKLEEAVKATAGIVMVWEGSMIEPRYCRAGQPGEPEKETVPTLNFWPVECPKEPGDRGKRVFSLHFQRKNLHGKINEIPEPQEAGRTVSADQLPDQIQIGSRDESGYVENLQIGVSQYTGEEVQYALGLASSCFVLEPWEDGIRAVVKGIGHGYGLSQAEANERAKEGWKAEGYLNVLLQTLLLFLYNEPRFGKNNIEVINVKEKVNQMFKDKLFLVMLVLGLLTMVAAAGVITVQRQKGKGENPYLEIPKEELIAKEERCPRQRQIPRRSRRRRQRRRMKGK